MKCKNCGHDNDLDSAFCEECGSKLVGGPSFGRNPQSKPKKEGSKTTNNILIVAIVALVIILGIMGGILLKLPGNSTPVVNNTTANNSTVTEQISLTAGVPVSQVPGLAQAISGTGVGFTTISYGGVTLDKNQCLYILSKGIVMINNAQTGNIPINQYKNPDNAYGTVTSTTITKTEYVDMAQRTYIWMDNNGQSPNYIGIKVSGQPDLSPDTLLSLYSKVLTQYKSTGQLPVSVTIP
ncbi:pseudomurein-binding repeat-containing protein [Methanobacterium sp.]|uniref:pseudomurein-binding repeat-containing protein n=1 Tax=Methanobacterium sp. TaxID=2164 RepID=UPI0025CFB69A|nr:pseudomurein-binding repeat-containing protein [Methanobacterium sp.]MBI5459728.1 zinc-ribbon domain-containing protein [Methanobacterium sp.]